MSENNDFSSSRRKMLGMGLVGGAALLSSAVGAHAATYNVTTPNYEPRCVTDPAFGVDGGPLSGQGAIPGLSDTATVGHNTEVFRKACASYEPDYAQLAGPIEVYVPAGAWYLRAGFTVPYGCQLRGAGFGATQIILTQNSPALPIVTVGALLSTDGSDAYYGASIDQNGIYQVTAGYSAPGPFGQPAPVLQDLLLSVNSVDVQAVRVVAHGFLLQRLWLWGVPSIEVNGASEGIISDIVNDGPGVPSLTFLNAQNIQVSNFLAYWNNYPIQFSGTSNNNIRFTNTSIIYTRYCPILFNPGSANTNIVFNGLSIICNIAYSTYYASILLRCVTLQLTITDGIFSYHPAWAIIGDGPGDQNQIVLNNCTFDGTPSSAAYNNDPANHTSGGIIANIHRLELNDCRFRNLKTPALNLGSGSTQPLGSSVIWNGGTIENYVPASGSPPNPIEMTYAAGYQMDIRMSNITSYDGVPMLNYTAAGDTHTTGRFVNCSSMDSRRDIVWHTGRNPAAYATRIATL